MSSRKVDRAKYGPSWTEVILGAALSFALGAILAAAVLIIKPVMKVRELPKEPEKNVLYYIEGSKDDSKGRQWPRKRQMLLAGSSVSLTEDELNTVFSTPAAKPPAAAPGGLIAPGTPNFRLVEGRLQIAVPCTLDVYGFKQDVLVTAVGGFRKGGDGFVFQPDAFYLGSLAVSRLPMAESFVTGRIIAAESIPDDLAAAWKKLSDVSVDGNTLKLTM
jgi:hypothetical protein